MCIAFTPLKVKKKNNPKWFKPSFNRDCLQCLGKKFLSFIFCHFQGVKLQCNVVVDIYVEASGQLIFIWKLQDSGYAINEGSSFQRGELFCNYYCWDIGTFPHIM